jgi:hypothetical protein
MTEPHTNERKIPGWVWMAGVFLVCTVLVILVWWYYQQRIEALDKILEK